MQFTSASFLKKEPISAAALPEDQKMAVEAGRSYPRARVVDQRAGHLQVELPGGAGRWWVFKDHVQGLQLGVKLAVPYQSQRDNYRDASRTCFSSSNAMLLMALRPGAISSDDDYIERLFRIGDTTDASVQLQTLASYGIKANFHQNGSLGDLKAQLDAGIPAPCGILHHGPASAPCGGGHWICVIGYADDANAPGGGTFIVHDPWGEIDHASGTYPSTNGEARRYSYKLMAARWTAEGPGSGWWIKAAKP